MRNLQLKICLAIFKSLPSFIRSSKTRHLKFRKPDESIHKAARLKSTVSSNLTPSRSIPFLFYLPDPPSRLLSDDLSTSIWFVRLICFARDVRRKGGGEGRRVKLEKRRRKTEVQDRSGTRLMAMRSCMLSELQNVVKCSLQFRVSLMKSVSCTAKRSRVRPRSLHLINCD